MKHVTIFKDGTLHSEHDSIKYADIPEHCHYYCPLIGWTHKASGIFGTQIPDESKVPAEYRTMLLLLT